MDYDISKYPNLVRKSLEKAINLQQNFYELSADWNYYKKDEHDYLKQNIKYSLCGESELETDTDSLDADGEKKTLLLEQTVDTVYRKILEASRSQDSLYVGMVFNILCNNTEKEEQVIPVPILKVRRCMERANSHRDASTESDIIGKTALYPYCVRYIDPEGRIYVNWTDYVTSNTLPECLMVVPTGGFYQPNPHRETTEKKSTVWLEIGPSVSTGKKVLTYVDMASTALGVGALGVGVVALAAPVAAPIALAGTVCGTVSGLYATGRSTHQLVDRHNHQQSISAADRTARSAWLGVAGGLAGGVSSASTFLLSKAARTGMTLGIVAKTTYNTIAIGNIVINGVGIGNGIYSIYQNYTENDKFSVLEIGQVAAHILFFGNAVMRFQGAETIISNTQRQVLQDYEQSLRSNKHRKAFNRIKRNTRGCNSDSLTADSEIIRGVRSIKNKDDFFAGVVRNRKTFNAAKAEVTFKDGYAMINDKVRFDPVALSQQPKDIKLNTVNAAEPFRQTNAQSFSPSNRMEIPAYNETVDRIQQMIAPIIGVAGISTTVDGLKFLGLLILELKEYCFDDSAPIIVKLSKIALNLVKSNRYLVNQSLEKLMHFVWSSHIKPEVDLLLEDMGIDLGKVIRYSDLANVVRDAILFVIDEIFDSVESLLENVINNYDCSADTQPPTFRPVVCSDCSGYILQN